MSLSDLELWREFTSHVTPLRHRPVATSPPRHERIPARPIGHTLDLHGLTLTEAFAATRDFLSRNMHSEYRYVTIITGLSGRIRHEFHHWIEGHTVHRVEELNGGGGVRIYFRKRRR